MTLHSVILAGGSGTRFWPASRQTRPKQFLSLHHGNSLLLATVDRVKPLSGPERTWILTNPGQAPGIAAVVPGFRNDQIMIEPEARDTAPCVALAAATIEAREPGAHLALMPADHLIEPAEQFRQLLLRGQRLAKTTGSLVTFGIEPDHPATGFGYIEKGRVVDDEQPAAFQAARFREKPDAATARDFLASGQFLWNAGIFLTCYADLLRAMQTANPELAQCMIDMHEAALAGDQARLAAAFLRTPKQSIDYAVMERAPSIIVVEARLVWNDLGSFLALDAVANWRDSDGNHALLLQGARVLTHEARNCVVYAETDQTVTLFGTTDLVVVAVGDAIMVCPRTRTEDLKQLSAALRTAGRTDLS